MLRPLASLFVSLILSTSVSAQESRFQTDASHAVILDFDTGQVLYSKNAGEPMPPASMSKLMTTLMVFEALDRGQLSLDDELPVSEYAWRQGGAASGSSTMFLEVGSRATVRDLLRGVIVQSGNDACIVLAEALEGTEANFAVAMTERARELGLESATFANSTGWPHPDHRISAEDLARVAQIIIAEYPEYYAIYAEPEYTYNGIRQYNRNPLLSGFLGADGLKTGHTEESGYGLVASAIRDGDRRIVVFNGMDSMSDRANEAERLMRAAFTEFELYELVRAGQPFVEADVALGTSVSVPLRASEGIHVGLHRRDREGVTAEAIFSGPIAAPIAEGDVIGELIITLPGGEVRTVPLEAAMSVERKGLVGRALSSLSHMIRGS